jgi:serine/threonine-protein kinase
VIRPELTDESLADLIGRVADEFTDRQRHGDNPSVEEYARQHPAIADVLRGVLSAVKALAADTAEGVAGDTPHPPGPPDRERGGFPVIPRYEILSVLGRGGMGVVYEARQHELDRVVALKVIRAGDHAGPDERARFRQEGLAAARLQHPNIVQVFDVGEHAGTPFLALEFVPGGSLAHRLAGRPLPPPVAARLMELLALAVQHAHDAGVIHRDLKPANVLLAPAPGDPLGVPKVTDFGLAKPLGGDALTATGAMVGTPAYMSPEQALGRGPVGPAADVWSLGAVLYECLTGRPPFHGATQLETLDAVRHRDPPSPREWVPALPRDLVTVCMKCLQKEPTRRYASAVALADDLRRFQLGEPVVARPIGSIVRAWRWCRRHPLAATLAAGVLLGLIGTAFGLAVVSGKNRELARANQDLRVSRDAETAARDRTRQTLHGVTDSVLGQFLGRQVRVGDDERQFLRRIQTRYEEFAASQGDSDQARRDRAECYSRLADIRKVLGEMKEAEAAYREAVAVRAAVAADRPDDPGDRHNMALAQVKLGLCLRDLGGLPEAERLFGQAAADARSLRDNAPDEPRFRQLVATCQHNLGDLHRQRNQPAEAEEAYRESIRELTHLTNADPSNHEYLAALAGSHNNLATLLRAARRLPEAETEIRTALALRERLIARFTGSPTYTHQLAQTHQNLAAVLSNRGRPEDAVEATRRSIGLHRGLAEQYPAVPQYTRDLAASLYNLGFDYHLLNRWADAEEVLTEAVGIFRKLADSYPAVPRYQSEMAAGWLQLGMVRKADGRLDAAADAYREVITANADLARRYPTNPAYQFDLFGGHLNLGVVLDQAGRAKPAEEAYTAARQVIEALAAKYPNAPAYAAGTADVLVNLAELSNKAGRHKEAKARLLEARPHVDVALKADPKHPQYRRTDRNQRLQTARALIGLGDHVGGAAEAEAMARLGIDPGLDTYEAATQLAKCAALVAADAAVPEADRDRRVKEYAERAVEQLRATVHEVKNRAKLNLASADTPERAFAPIAAHTDVAKLLADLRRE